MKSLTKRQGNGTIFLPNYLWKAMGVEVNEEIEWEYEEGKDGVTITLRKKQ